jgi:hypothetical protein
VKHSKELLSSSSHASSAPTDSDCGEALTVGEVAKRARLGRTLIYDAINPEKAAEKGLPVLPSFKIGKLRRVRAESFRTWLRTLEARAA